MPNHTTQSDQRRSLATHLDKSQPPMLSGYSPQLYSKLYCRLNGFMFGVFFEMCKFKLARERYPFFRGRMQTFLDEIAVPGDVPERHEDFNAWTETEVDLLLRFFKTRPQGLVDFFAIGHLAVTYLIRRLRDRPEAEEARRAAHLYLRRQKQPSAAFDALVDPEGKPAKTVDEIVSPALNLAVTLLRDLRPEPKTCFLAMPFRDPYEAYYDTYYRPLLAKSGFRCVRAWGGFGQEDFSPLLVALILKSGALFADLTESSPNVLWEVGVAQGAGKRVFLVRNSAHDVPADLAKHVTLPYEPRGETWARDTIEQHHLLLLMQTAAMEKHGADPIRIAAGVRVAEVGAMVRQTQDLLADAAFFAMRERGENDANGHIRRGMQRVKERRWADAEADFTYALDHGGHAPSASFGRGMVRLRLDRNAEAERDLTAAIDQGVDEALAYYFRALARFGRGRYRYALADLDSALAKEPHDLAALQLRIHVYVRLDRTDDAECDCLEAERVAPLHPGTQGARGFLHLARGEFAEAARRFKQARAKSFGRGWRFEAGLATLLAGDFDGAAREYETGLRRATDSDIDDGLRELSFWTRKHSVAARSEYRRAMAKIRKRLRMVRPQRKTR